jgi:hypothetical protein
MTTCNVRNNSTENILYLEVIIRSANQAISRNVLEPKVCYYLYYYITYIPHCLANKCIQHPPNLFR